MKFTWFSPEPSLIVANVVEILFGCLRALQSLYVYIKSNKTGNQVQNDLFRIYTIIPYMISPYFVLTK